MNNSTDILENLLESFVDEERSFYFKTKMSLEEGLKYKIAKLVISDRVATFRPLNLIKPFFPLFFTNQKQFYQAQYKKRKIQTSLRGNLSGIPIFMDDKIEFSIHQGDKVMFIISDYVSSLMNEFFLKINQGEDIIFKIKLIESGNSRQELEKPLESSSYINHILQQAINYFQSSRFIIAKHKERQNKIWVKETLGLDDFDIKNLTLNHLMKASKDVMIIEKIIASFKSGNLSTEENIQMKKDKLVMKRYLDNTNKSDEFSFDDTMVVLNCIFS